MKFNSIKTARRWLIAIMLAHSASAFALTFNIPISSLTNHNTSAHPAYNESLCPANFGTSSWISPDGATIAVDPAQTDLSLNSVTPAHVSRMNVHSLIPKRPDLRWFAHLCPWFGSSLHMKIGLINNSTAYVASMIEDMKRRGFDGVVIDWWGQGGANRTDEVTQKIKSYLASQPGNQFTYIVSIDKGVKGGLAPANLERQIQYCQSEYFSDPNYEREPVRTGQPILMFFGVRSKIGEPDMIQIKSACGGNMVWVEQGTTHLSEPWEDGCFVWADDFKHGVNPQDQFNLSAVTRDISAMGRSGKKAFGAMCAQFNGTLTKKVGWSMGKYVPSGSGLCLVERAAAINAAIPANVTRMQWVTWNDWEEGSQVEGGIENNFALNPAVTSAGVLSWTVTSGDERTIDHYEIYASSDGVNAAYLGSVAAGTHQADVAPFNLPKGSYQLYIDAVGKPCIRDHLSSPVGYLVSQ